MLEQDMAVAQLTLATGQTAALRRGLSHRQFDLLALEQTVADLSRGFPVGGVVIDQAEDIRRALTTHAAQQLQIIRAAIALADAAVSRTAIGDVQIAKDPIVPSTGLVNGASAAARRTSMNLDRVAETVAILARSNSSERNLARTARIAVDKASQQLESARREAFALSEALPPLISHLWEGPSCDRPVSDFDGLGVEPQPCPSVDAEQPWLRPVSIHETRRDSPNR